MNAYQRRQQRRRFLFAFKRLPYAIAQAAESLNHTAQAFKFFHESIQAARLCGLERSEKEKVA